MPYNPLDQTFMKRLSIFLLLFSAFSHSASFDCKLAKADIEKMICDNPSLSQMDEVISTLYFKALKIEGNNVVKKEQRSWLRKRNAACQSAYYCEKVFANRIDELIHKSHLVQNVLTQGMTLPDESSLDETSASALSYDLIKEKYRPWPRKVLKTFGDNPRNLNVEVSGDEIYVYYTSGKWDSPTLYEYAPLTGKTFRIANVLKRTSYYIDGDKVYYYTNDDKNNLVSKHYYQVGTRSEQGIISSVSKDKFKGKSNISTLALSNDGKKLAMATESMYIDHYEEGADKQAAYFTMARVGSEWKKLINLNSIAIYDSESNDLQVMSSDALGSDWYIDNLIWAKDDSSVYFDNTGNWACIWEYRVKEGELYKIVPEHTAVEPSPFTYQGHDYILYFDDYTHKNLMIAVRPE